MDREWTEIIIEVNTKDVTVAEGIGIMVATNGIYIEDFSQLEEDVKSISHIDMIEDELLQKDKTKAFVHIYISPEESFEDAVSFLNTRLTEQAIWYNIKIDTVNEDDWANNWKKFFHPIEVGQRLVVKPEWEHYESPGRHIIEINPGVAFGSGTHETTQMCLIGLENHVEKGMSVLDIGCGSGILSIAACHLGASEVVGVDIDPLAVKISRENGLLNGLKEPQYKVIHGNLIDKIDSKYDVITANLVADVIIMLAPVLKKFMNENSVVISSGIIEERESDVLDALRKYEFAVKSISRQGSWVAIAFTDLKKV